MTMTPAEKISAIEVNLSDVRHLIIQAERRIEAENNDSLISAYDRIACELRADAARLREWLADVKAEVAA